MVDFDITKTEVSAVSAMTVGLGLGATGELIGAGVAVAVGVALVVASRVLGMRNIEVDEEDVETVADEVSDQIDELEDDE